MKQKNLRTLALLGITGGIITLSQATVHASETHPIDPHFLLAAEHKCGGPNGCPAAKSAKNNAHSLLAEADKNSDKDTDDGNLGYHLYTEDELLLELNDKGAASYKGLDSEGKALARLVASQRCNGTNECKGLNACQTDKNKCAGQGACKGQSKCAFSDKNLAVKVVADKLAKKRTDLYKGKTK